MTSAAELNRAFIDFAAADDLAEVQTLFSHRLLNRTDRHRLGLFQAFSAACSSKAFSVMAFLTTRMPVDAFSYTYQSAFESAARKDNLIVAQWLVDTHCVVLTQDFLARVLPEVPFPSESFSWLSGLCAPTVEIAEAVFRKCLKNGKFASASEALGLTDGTDPCRAQNRAATFMAACTAHNGKEEDSPAVPLQALDYLISLAPLDFWIVSLDCLETVFGYPAHPDVIRYLLNNVSRVRFPTAVLEDLVTRFMPHAERDWGPHPHDNPVVTSAAETNILQFVTGCIDEAEFIARGGGGAVGETTFGV